jgi:hypothetical protein
MGMRVCWYWRVKALLRRAEVVWKSSQACLVVCEDCLERGLCREDRRCCRALRRPVRVKERLLIKTRKETKRRRETQATPEDVV